jgi:sporulation protein YlmC with PRC-barrel domain
MEKISTKHIIGKMVVSSTGKHFGLLEDVEFVTESGELLNIILSKAKNQSFEIKLKTDDSGKILIPFSAVKSIGDFVVIDENELV